MEELKATQELLDINDEYMALCKCRDVCIDKVFKTKKATRYAKKAVKTGRKFWKLSVKLHPELSSGGWGFDAIKNVYTK